MVTWEKIRHQVAIAGGVTDAQTERAIRGARVEITDAPAEFKEWLEVRAIQYGDRWGGMAERPDRTRTAADGHFHFLDLPDGDYTLSASLPGAGSRYGVEETTVTVSRDGDNITVARPIHIALSPTTVKGTITVKGKIMDQNSQPVVVAVVMAQVNVKGSGERAFSNGCGEYLLTGLEASEKKERTLEVSAQGYRPATKTVTLSKAGAVQTLDFALVSS